MFKGCNDKMISRWLYHAMYNWKIQHSLTIKESFTRIRHSIPVYVKGSNAAFYTGLKSDRHMYV